jgi:hypothetical protein
VINSKFAQGKTVVLKVLVSHPGMDQDRALMQKTALEEATGQRISSIPMFLDLNGDLSVNYIDVGHPVFTNDEMAAMNVEQ